MAWLPGSRVKFRAYFGFFSSSSSSNINPKILIILSTTWQIGWQEVENPEYDVELAYDPYFNRYFNLFTGIDFTNDFERGIFGIRYLLPFNIESALRVDSRRSISH